MTSLVSVAQVKDNVDAVMARIDAVSGGRDIQLVAVTKAQPIELVTIAVEAGLFDLGENYAQELVSKSQALDSVDPVPRWHFIGGLQRNKIKLIAPYVSLWHSIDRSRLLDEIAARAPQARVLLQVNATGEESKSGCQSAEVPQLIEHGRELGLDVAGLMAVGPTDTSVDPRPTFSTVKELADQHGLTELSMGMSGDFEAAVSMGATIVRLGSVLFGSRPPR